MNKTAIRQDLAMTRADPLTSSSFSVKRLSDFHFVMRRSDPAKTSGQWSPVSESAGAAFDTLRRERVPRRSRFTPSPTPETRATRPGRGAEVREPAAQPRCHPRGTSD